MPASIIEFVDVNVSLTGASATKFSFGALMGVFDFAGAQRQYGPFFSAAEVQAAALGSANAEAWASVVFAQDDGVDQVIIGRHDAADATWSATMDAIEAEDSESWYLHTIEPRTDADVLSVAAWTEAREKIFIAQSADPDLIGGVAGNIGDQLKTAGYHRTALIYHATDAEALDGAWASSGGGLDLDAPDGAGTWAYRALESVPFDSVTATEAANVYAENANLFGRNKGLSFTSKGTAASSRFVDVTTSIDWLKARLEEAVLSAFVGATTKIPFTNAGINILVAAVQGVLAQGVTFGHLSPDELPQVIAPDVSQVSAADKAARLLTLQVTATLSGAVHKVTINVNLTQ